jgi:hypothetical protein
MWPASAGAGINLVNGLQMSTWRSSAQWRPRQFGWFVPTEFPPFVAWLTPCATGALMMIFTGAIPPWPERLDQLGLFGGYFLVTLLYSPLSGFPAILAAVPLRGILLSNGLFGWTSVLIAGATAGLAIPLMLGQRLWLDGPLYGAVYLWVQYAIYRARYPAAFDV